MLSSIVTLRRIVDNPDLCPRTIALRHEALAYATSTTRSIRIGANFARMTIAGVEVVLDYSRWLAYRCTCEQCKNRPSDYCFRPAVARLVRDSITSARMCIATLPGSRAVLRETKFSDPLDSAIATLLLNASWCPCVDPDAMVHAKANLTPQPV